MKSLRHAVAAAVLATSSVSLAATYELDPSHSAAGFAVKHLMVSTVRGTLGDVKGTIDFNEKDITKSSVEATVDATKLDTGDAKRDEHLKSPDFFDVAKHPTVRFKSSKVAKAGKNKLKVTGDLTLKGITKPVVLVVEGPVGPVKDPWGNTKVGATATTTINRKDFGLTWNKALESGGVLVGDEVKVTLELQAAKKAEAAPQQGSK